MRSACLILACSSLTACASAGDTRFPSLAIRPGERASGTIEPMAGPTPPSATSATRGRLAGLRDAALAAHARFAERSGRAGQLAAAAQGAAVASEAWSVAQVALADLESARSGAMIALADLDALYVAAADAAVPTGGSGDLDAIAATREEVTRLIVEEDAVLAGLRQRLRE